MTLRFWTSVGLALSMIVSAHAEDVPQRGGTLTYGIIGDPDTYDCHRTA
jgi:hypothetical protein